MVVDICLNLCYAPTKDNCNELKSEIKMGDITNINDNKILPDAELDIMRVIWSTEKPLCAREIAKLLGNTRGWKTTTAHVLLGRLCERGYLECDKSGYVYYYTALVAEDNYRAVETKSFLRRVANDSAKSMVASLIESEPLTDEDIAELTAIINRKRERND